jgi:tetratricopeptide (TPR) repeat protein
MTLRKVILVIGTIISLSAVCWFILLYRAYGMQTLLFLVRSSPDTVWTYTAPLIQPAFDQAKNTIQGPGFENLLQPTASPLPPPPEKHYTQTMSHMYQKLNNCGPSSAAMAASTLGVNFDQFVAADVMKGSYGDKNVAAEELVSYLESRGLKAIHRYNGNAELLEQLVSRDIPVIVEQWLLKRGSNELTGHYRVMRGYDQKARIFTTNDSFNGPNFTIPYDQFDAWWRPFNRGYVVVYKAEQEDVVKQVLGNDWDTIRNYQGAAAVAEAEIKSTGDGYAYFNSGTSEALLKNFVKAETAYDEALKHTFPPLFLWYQFGPLETYTERGKYDRVFEMTDKLLKAAGEVEEARYYRGLSYLKQGKKDEAKAEFEKAIAAHPRYTPAREELDKLK